MEGRVTDLWFNGLTTFLESYIRMKDTVWPLCAWLETSTFRSLETMMSGMGIITMKY